MDPTTLLSQLRDVQPPPDISWWPPAPLWWVLACLLLCCLIGGAVALRRWRRKTAWRRSALQELNNLEAAWSANHDPRTLTRIIILLKRALASAQGTPAVMTHTSQDWRESLRKTGVNLNEEELALLSEQHYKPDPPVMDQQVFATVRRVLKGVNNA